MHCLTLLLQEIDEVTASVLAPEPQLFWYTFRAEDEAVVLATDGVYLPNLRRQCDDIVRVCWIRSLLPHLRLSTEANRAYFCSDAKSTTIARRFRVM